jgi:glycosyltransferase involved in cell wall biosynthesis
VIAGGPQRPKEQKYYAELQALAAELGIAHRVRFVGQRSDIPRLLAASDIYFQPNQAPEPFGIAFIEAMLAGLPLVAPHLGALDEYVTPETGILAADDSGLVAGLASLLQAPSKRAEMGHNARLRATELCQPERQVAKLAEILGSAWNSSQNTFSGAR